MATSGATLKKPSHHMTLSDGTTTVGLMLANALGKDEPKAIRRTPYPRQSTKIATTDNKYSNLEPPYYNLLQDDWTGGRGSLNLEEDTTRYMDSFRAWTDQNKQICNGPQETYCQNYGASYRQNFDNMPGANVTWQGLASPVIKLAHSFTTVAAATLSNIAVIVKRYGLPTGPLSVELWTNVAGEPGALINAATITTADITDTISQLREVTFTNVLAPATTYWIVVQQSSGSPDTSNYWALGINPLVGTDSLKFVEGSSVWTSASYEFYYRVIDNNNYNFKFFEYKRAVYVIDLQNGGLFLNGDRGAADSNVGVLTTLIDATKAWTNDEWIGCTVLITKGPGAADKQPWRTITDNDATTLTVSPAWETAHTIATEYVILGSNRWIWKTNVGAATDVAVADEFAYICSGGNTVVQYNERNVAGVWTLSTPTETIAKANKLRAINTPAGWELWGSLDNHAKHGSCVWRAKVPKLFSASSDLYNLVTVLDDGKGVWDEQAITNVTVSQGDDGVTIALAAGFTTGDACSKEIPVTDITKGNKIGMMIKSSVTTSAGDLKLKLDDTPLLKRNYLPDKVWHYDAEVLPNDVVWRRHYYKASAVHYYDASAGTVVGDKWFLIENLRDYNSAYDFKINWIGVATTDYLYVSHPERIKEIYIGMGATKNAVAASVMTGEIWDGDSWIGVVITDGTSVGAVTLAQSGLITITTTSDWNMGCSYTEASYLAADRYHIRFKVDKDLTANVQIQDLVVRGDGETEKPEDYDFVSLKNVIDSDYSSYHSSIIMTGLDNLYIRYNKRFNRIKFKFDALNNNNPTILTARYWDGWQWIAVSITDGTRVDMGAGSYATFAIDGDVTFTIPSDWAPGCPTYLQPYLSATDFVIELKVSEYLDDVHFNKITLEDDNLNEIFGWDELTNVKDGDTSTYDYLNLKSDDYTYVMFGSKYNKVYWTLSVANAVDTTMAAQYFNGHVWSSLTLTDGTAVGGFTLHQSGAMSFTIPHDWQEIAIGQESGYAVRFYPAVDLTSGVKITELYVQNDDAQSLSIPALTANIWAYVEIAISPNANPNPDDSNIVSIGLNVAVDNGAQTITIAKIDLITSSLDYFKLGNDRINSIEAYGSERMNPWIFTESMIYEIQTQNDNAVVPIPLREIASLRSEINGQAHTTSNVYLVFNLGARIEKYYLNNLDDVGPDKDEGLPSNRQGDPSCLLSYPGKMLLSIDAKTTGYSTILMRSDSGWHEIYRAPYGCPIHDMIVQVIPGMSTRLWVSQEYDILWLPMPTNTWNPKNDSNFRYTHESVVTTGWINIGFTDLLKFWKAVKLYSENLDSNQYVNCQYQIEDGSLENGWTTIAGTFDASPFEEQLISASYNVTARRIRFRFILYTNSNLESPIIKATIFEALLRFPVKYSYACNVRLEDHPESLTGRKDMLTTVEEVTAQLETWSDAPTVLTWRCPYSPYDNKKVVLEPLSMRPLSLDAEAQFENHIGELILMEV